jgi:hypothetical protein
MQWRATEHEESAGARKEVELRIGDSGQLCSELPEIPMLEL